MKQFLFLLLFISFGCRNSKESFIYKLEKTKTKSIVGDFDGDKIQDTLREIVYSNKSQLQVNEVIASRQYEFDTIANWYVKNNIQYKLFLSKKCPEIYLSNSMGLYFLKNIGDINNDGKDEIALVIDKIDYSRVNSCLIYTLCNNEWEILKNIGLHEDSFDYYGDNEPVFDEIKDYLEQKNNIWYYLDYHENDYESAEEVGKMKVLSVEKCN